MPNSHIQPHLAVDEEGSKLQRSLSRDFPTDSLLDIQSYCQKQIEQLAELIPTLAAWIIYRQSGSHERQVIEYLQQERVSLHEETLSYLKSEAWLESGLPVKLIVPISVDFQAINQKGDREKITRQEVGNQPPVDNLAYLYIFDENRADEYLLLWTQEPLCDFQQKNLQRQAELLQDRLAITFKCFQQQEEIQRLKQVVQKGEHQLRNSLAMIGLYAENLCLGLSDSSFNEQAHVIRDTVNELSANLTNLLNCVQQKKLDFAQHDLKEILLETLILLQPRLDEKELSVDLPKTSVTLAVDKWQMKQVFENLLSNAIDFSPVREIITFNWRVFRQEVVVEICDRGCGLSPEDLKNAFTPFYSQRSGGTGLGLTIAKKIILDHQGSIWAENIPSGGAQFTFTLPRNV